MIKPVEIKGKIIGEDFPTLLTAELACAHQGNVENACEMVKVAQNARADAIQTQVFKNELEMSPIHKEFNEFAYLELSDESWLKVFEAIKKTDALFLSAVYDLKCLQFLIENEVDAFKIHSADISNPEMLVAVAKSGKPIFLSTGASTIEEIKKAVDILKRNDAKDIILMHGYQGFPTKIEDTNLKFIKTLKRMFGLNVGFYDHVDGGSILAKIIPIMAIGYGAQVIEKHFILTRKDKGVDYQSSLDAENFIEFVQLLRESEKAIGTKNIRDFTEGELKYRSLVKKSIVANVDIPKGTKITRDKVEFLRNEVTGILPDKFKEIEGKVVKRNVIKYHNLTYDDF